MNIHSARSELSHPPRMTWTGMVTELALILLASAILAKFFVS